MMPDHNIETKSDILHEILGVVPHWIIRWGITTIFITILLLLFLTWFIRYPDVLPARISITTANPPVSVIARSSGKIVRLFVKENEYVESNAYLAAIENPANIDDIFRIKQGLDEFEKFLTTNDTINGINLYQNARLGEMQSYYSRLSQSYLNYKYFVQDNYLPKRIDSIKDQIKYYRNLNNNLHKQKDILTQEFELVEKKYNMNQALYKKGHISEIELTNTESSLLGKKYALQNAKSSIINNDIQLVEYEKIILDLNQQYDDRRREYIQSLQGALRSFHSQLAVWEQQYILKAPMNGNVAFFNFWSGNQFVNIGDEVMTIVPNSQDMIGKVFLPVRSSGKVKTGQKVKIKFDSYPFNEFGIVEGIVESISLVARQNQYRINIQLINGLKTSYQETLEFKQEMQGTAEIITEDLRLIEKILYRFRSILSE